jgi:hypothetical protein
MRPWPRRRGKRVCRMRGPVPSVRASTGRMGTHIHRMPVRISPMGACIEAMRARLSLMDARIHRMRIRISPMGACIEAMRARLSLMDARIHRMRVRISPMGAFIEAMRACIPSMRARCSLMDARIQRMRVRIPPMRACIQSMRARLPLEDGRDQLMRHASPRRARAPSPRRPVYFGRNRARPAASRAERTSRTRARSTPGSRRDRPKDAGLPYASTLDAGPAKGSAERRRPSQTARSCVRLGARSLGPSLRFRRTGKTTMGTPPCWRRRWIMKAVSL